MTPESLTGLKPAVRRHPTALAAVLMTTALALASCTSDDSSGSAASSGNDANSGGTSLLPEPEGTTDYPVTIPHSRGEVEIEDRPERIAAVDGGGFSVELVAALGVTPVVANAPQQWTKEALNAEIEKTTEPTVLDEIETIANSDPDLIVTTGEVDEFYTQLAEIAPVLVLDNDTEVEQAWSSQIDALGIAFDLQSAAQRVKEDSRHFFVDFRNEHPAIQGLTVSYLVMFQDGRLLYSAARTATTDTFLQQLGFERNPEDAKVSEEPFLSLENLSLVDADFMILTNHGAADPSDLDRVTGSPLWNELQATRDGNWVRFGTSTNGYSFDGEEHEGNLAYALAWPGPLSEVWAAKQLGPMLDSVV